MSFAIEKEIEAAEFYEEASGQENFSGTRDVLIEFAQEERKHQRLLEALSDEAEEQLEAYDFQWVPDLKRSDHMVEMAYQPGMHYVDLLRLAMKREEVALRLYNKLAAETEKESHIRLFRMLSQEEAKHKQFLEALFDDYMAEVGD